MPVPAAQGRILLVDDDPMIVRLVKKILAAKGLGEVVHAASGREALERLDDNGVAVVLLDHQLPDSTGLDVLDAIRARPHPPAVVMITAHGNESLAATALRRGADDYLAKDASLAEMLPQVLERVRRARELRKALAASQRDLLRAERLAAIGEMTVTLHHEINNPLMSAFADVELLLADPAMPESKRWAGLQEIQTALRRIRDIVRQIGDLREIRTKSYVAGVRMVDLTLRADRAGAEPRPRGGAAGRRGPDPGGIAAAPTRRLRGASGRRRGRSADSGGGRRGSARGGERGQRCRRRAPVRRVPGGRAPELSARGPHHG